MTSNPTVIPVKIRPQLVPFLFKEFEGKEAAYDFRTAKSVYFLPSSSITSYLYTQINYCKTIKKQDKFIFYLTVDHKTTKSFNGVVFIDKNGIKETLYMEEQKVREFNNLLEDLFRSSMKYYIDGCLECGLQLSAAFQKFIEKYQLEEVGFDTSSLIRLYYREKKTPNLFRFQSKSGNRVMNFF
jgi:hypothetical protein